MRRPCSGDGTSHEWASVPTPPSRYLHHHQHAALEPGAAARAGSPRADSTSSPTLASRSIQCTPPSKSAPPPAIAGSSRQPGRRWLFTATRLKKRISPSVARGDQLRAAPGPAACSSSSPPPSAGGRSAPRRRAPRRSPTRGRKAGFSSTTCLPASSAASVSSRCESGGVATTTASTLGSAIAAA